MLGVVKLFQNCRRTFIRPLRVRDGYAPGEKADSHCRASGINCRPVRWLRDALLVGARTGEPCFLGNLNLTQRLVGSLAVRGTELQIGNVRDPTFVLRAPKKVDVVFAHISHQELSRFLPLNQATGESDKL